MPSSVYMTACLLATSTTNVVMSGLLALGRPLKVVDAVCSTSSYIYCH
jgi:hypothetical protein